MSSKLEELESLLNKKEKPVTYSKAVRELKLLGYTDISRDNIVYWNNANHLKTHLTGTGKKAILMSELIDYIKKAGKSKAEVSEVELPPPDADKEDIEEYVKRLLDNPKDLDIADTTIFKNLYDALIKKQKLDIEKGLYTLSEDVERASFQTARVLREQLNSLPERLSAELATMRNKHEIKELLYKELNEMMININEDLLK